MKKSTVRIFAMVLAALMVLSLLPLAYAHAEETEIPVGTEIPGFIWVGDQLMEDGHRYGEVVDEDFLVNPEDPGDCVTPAVYWKSCINVNPYSGESCGVTAQADWNQAMERLKTELAQRRANGEKADFESIFVNAIAELDAKYKFTGEPKGHTWVEVEYQPATCEQAGWETFHYCADCGERSGYVELPPTGHRFVDGVCEICGIDDPNYVPPMEIEEEETQNDASSEDVEPADDVNELEENWEETPGVNGDNAEGAPAAPIEGGEDEQKAVEQAADEQPEDEPEQTSDDQPEDEPEQINDEQPEDEPEQTNDEQPKDEPEQTNKVEVYTGEVTVEQTAATEDVVESFTNAAWDYLGLTNENTAGVSVQNVTPYKEDGTELSDEEIPEEGIDFEMDIPENFDPNNQDIEIYHLNKDGVWEKMQIVDINLEDNKIIVRKVRSFSPFALTVKRLDDQIAIVTKPSSDMPAFHAGPAGPFTVTFDPDGGTLTGEPSRKTDENGKLTLPAASECTKDGYTLVGWTKEGGKYNPGSEGTFTEDTALKAKWAKNVKIIFDVNAVGGSGEMPSQDKDADGNPLYAGEVVQLNENKYTNEPNLFKCWSDKKNPGKDDKTYEDKGEIELPEDDITLYAQWSRTHTVTFKPGDGATGEEKTQLFQEGTTAALTKLETLGYTSTTAVFVNWKDQDGKTYTDGQSVTPTKDLTLTAQWEKKYTVTFYGSGGSTGKGETTATQIIRESAFTAAGEKGVALAANPFKREDYVFTGWCTKNDNVPTIQDKEPVKADAFTEEQLALYGCWANKVTVTFDPNYDTPIKPRTQEVPKDVETALNKNTYIRSGYLFVGWYKNKECTGTALESIKTSSDVTLYAKWAGPVYITGSVSGVGNDAYVGETLTAKVDNAAGITDFTYQWVYWGVGKNPTTGKTLTGWVNITGETGKTYVPKADKDGKRIACRVTRNGVNILTGAKTVTGTLKDVKWKQDLVDVVDGKAVSDYAQPGQIQGVTKDMEYSTNGTTWSKVTDVSDKGVVSILTPATYKFRIAGTKIESDPIVIDRWFSLGYSTSNGTTTSTTSSGTTTATSGSGTATMRCDGKAMPTQTSATSANPNVKRYAGKANMWLVKEGAEETITLTIRPSAGSYGHWNLNGGSYHNTGSETTVTVTPMSGPEHYYILFNRSSSSPRTADESRLGLWAAMCVTSLTGAAAILTQTRKRRKNVKE